MIKMIQLAKFLFYNILTILILISCTSIHLNVSNPDSGDFNDVSMVFTFIVVILLFITMLIKSIVGIIYFLIYKVKNKNSRSNHLYQDIKSHFWEKLDEIKGSIYNEIRKNLEDKVEEMEKKLSMRYPVVLSLKKNRDK